MPSQGWSGAARFGLPGVLLGLVLSWGGSGGKSLQAQNSGPVADRSRPVNSAEASGTIVLTTPFAGNSGGGQLLYLVDTKQHVFAIYRIDGQGTVKLDAVRQYEWDLKLSEYNTQGLKPSDIEASVKAGAAMRR